MNAPESVVEMVEIKILGQRLAQHEKQERAKEEQKDEAAKEDGKARAKRQFGR